MIVTRVNQDNEALGFITLAMINHRKVVHDDGGKLAWDPEIVSGRQRLRAEIVQRKSCHSHRGLRHSHDMTLPHEVVRRAGNACEPLPRVIERCLSLSEMS